MSSPAEPTVMGDRARSLALSPRLRQAMTPTRMIAAAFVLLLFVVMVAAPLLAPADPLAQDVTNRLLKPGQGGALLGTDALGRDLLSRLMYGARVELLIALGATSVAAVLGTLLGLLGGYFGGLVEALTMRLVVDVLLAFPPIILALMAVTLTGPGPLTLIMAMGVLFAPVFARITYGQVLSAKRQEYVEAATAFGASTPVRLFRIILPNVSAPIIVQFSLTIANAILLESGLSYLGLGVVPPTPSWGSMVAEGQRYLATDPFFLLVPGTAIVLTILAFGLLGDGLRQWLDPKSRSNR